MNSSLLAHALLDQRWILEIQKGDVEWEIFFKTFATHSEA